jgi:hypothetical protein
VIHPICTIDHPELKRQLIVQGFELADNVGHRLIITGRMVNGSMHSVLPILEIIAIDGNTPIFQTLNQALEPSLTGE